MPSLDGSAAASGVSSADGATSRRTSVAGTHAIDLVEAKGLRLEVVGSCLATVGGPGAWVRADDRSGDTRDDHRQGPQAGRPFPDAEDRRALCRRPPLRRPRGDAPRASAAAATCRRSGHVRGGDPKGTGKGWDDWFRVLDGWDATSRSHTEIARYVNGEHGVDGWWAQSVTVGYERARGHACAQSSDPTWASR